MGFWGNLNTALLKKMNNGRVPLINIKTPGNYYLCPGEDCFYAGTKPGRCEKCGKKLIKVSSTEFTSEGYDDGCSWFLDIKKHNGR